MKKEEVEGIIIYTTPKVLLHKQGKLPNDDDYSESGIYFWRLSRVPKKHFEKIYFATEGTIKGYFEISGIEDFWEEVEIEFHCKTWTPIKEIPQKPFQGFKYLSIDQEGGKGNL